jgi:hypothetical protein
MISPTSGSVLPGASATFTWSTNAGIAQAWMWVGTTAGGSQLGSYGGAGVTSATPTNLPINGSTVYVRLWSLISGNWTYNDYTYVSSKVSITTSQNEIASGETGQVYAQNFNASGGSGNYSWNFSGLPAGIAQSANNPAEIIGQPTTVNNSNVTVQVTDTVTNLTASQSYTIHIGNGTDASNTGLLYGTYHCYYQGNKNDGTAEAMVWTMKLNCTTASDGSCSSGGYIKDGVLDFNSTSGSTTLATPATIVANTGPCNATNCYTVGSDMRGTLKFSYTANRVTTNNTFAIAIGNWQQRQSQQKNKDLAMEWRITRIDDIGDGSSSYTASGQYGAGQCFREDVTIGSSNTASSINGFNWVFGLSGVNSSNQPEAAAGVFATCGGPGACGGTATTGIVSNGLVDLASGNTASSGTAVSGTYITDVYSTSGTNGDNRFRVSISSGLPATNWVLYVIDPIRAFMMSLDPPATNGLLVGQLRVQQQSTYSAANLNGPFVLYESGATVPTSSGTQGYFTNLMQGMGGGAGNVTIQASIMNENGQAGTSSNGTSAVTVQSNGRTALGSSWLYLYDNNQAIYLDNTSNSGSQNVGLGWLEAQSSTTPGQPQQNVPLPFLRLLRGHVPKHRYHFLISREVWLRLTPACLQTLTF